MPSIHEILAVKRWPNGGVSIGNSYLGITPPTNGMIIEGDVGIGTASPGAMVEISKNDTAETRLRLSNTESAAGYGSKLEFWSGYDGGHIDATLYARPTGIGVNRAGFLHFQTKTAGGALTDKMVIDEVGNVKMLAYGAGTATFDASGNITSVSDERLKTNIEPLPYGLKEVLSWKPIRHQWGPKSGLDTVGVYHGFSAQNIQETAPGLVHTNPEGWLSFEDRGVLGTTVVAAQELHARIVNLEAELGQLRTQVSRMS